MSGSADTNSQGSSENHNRPIGTPSPGKKSLHDAVIKGDSSVVTSLISAGASLDDVDENGTPPLLLAINEGRCNMVQQLIDSGVNVNASDSKGNTGLHQAILKMRDHCKDRGLDCRKSLLSAGCSLNLANADGDTPLMLAVKDGELDVVQELINAGASVDALDSQPRIRLHLALLQEDWDTAQTLLNAGVFDDCVDLSGNTCLTLAVASGQTDLVQQLIDAGADVNYIDDKDRDDERHKRTWRDCWITSTRPKSAMQGRMKSPLHIAAHEGHVEILKLLLERGADPNRANTRRYSVLSTATRAKCNRIPILNLLLDYSADMYVSGVIFDKIHDKINPLPFEGMLENNYLEGVKLFLDRGFNLSKFRLPDGTSTSPLKAAVQIGDAYSLKFKRNISDISTDTKMLSFFLDYYRSKGTLSSEIDRSDSSGWSPLLHTIIGRHKHAALLLKAGANPNHQDKIGYSALWHVLLNGEGLRYQSIRMLIEAGAHLGAPEYDRSGIDRLLYHVTLENQGDQPYNSFPFDSSDDDCDYDSEGHCYDDQHRVYMARKAMKKLLCMIKFTALSESRFPNREPIYEKIRDSATLRNYYEDCKAEIAYSQSCQLDSSVTYYDILTNENFWKRVKFSKVMDKFHEENHPKFNKKALKHIRIYRNDFQDRWASAFDQYKLWRPATKGLEVLLGWDRDTYYMIFDNILDHLDREDWRNLSEIGEDTNSSVVRSIVLRLKNKTWEVLGDN